MGFSLGGLIGGAMQGLGEGYTAVAKGALENQQKLDYQREILRLTEEKELRIDEATRDRNIRDIGRKATAEAQSKLDTAPVLAQADVASAVSKIDASTKAGLPEREATYRGRQLEASAPNVTREAEIKGGAAATEAVSRVGTKGYIDAVSREDVAKAAGEKSIQALRNEGLVEREQAKPPRTGAGGGNDTSLDLERRFKAAERNLAQELGVATNKVNEELAYLQRKAEQGDQKAKDRLTKIQPAVADWQTANTALRNFTRKPNPSGAAAPDGAASAPSGRPPLSSFGR